MPQLSQVNLTENELAILGDGRGLDKLIAAADGDMKRAFGRASTLKGRVTAEERDFTPDEAEQLDRILAAFDRADSLHAALCGDDSISIENMPARPRQTVSDPIKRDRLNRCRARLDRLYRSPRPDRRPVCPDVQQRRG